MLLPHAGKPNGKFGFGRIRACQFDMPAMFNQRSVSQIQTPAVNILSLLCAYADFVKTQAKRGYCIVGDQDSFAVEGTSALAFRLPNIGISCFVERHSNLEHDYPSDFEKSLSKAVEYVSSK